LIKAIIEETTTVAEFRPIGLLGVVAVTPREAASRLSA
jgi:hypothetical protein